MTGLALPTGVAAPGPVRPRMLQRPQRPLQRYGDLIHRETAAPAAPPAGDPPATPQRKKGKRPTHELIRVVQVDGRKAYQPVAVLWLRENGKGFLKPNVDLKAGDDFMIVPLRNGGAS